MNTSSKKVNVPSCGDSEPDNYPMLGSYRGSFTYKSD